VTVREQPKRDHPAASAEAAVGSGRGRP
jgi:hypothetical protein